MARGSRIDEEFKELPSSVTDYVRRLVRMIGYLRKVRREVQRELLSHFADALCDGPSPEETQATSEQLISEFGDPQLLAVLCRRAKKRCRPLWLRAIARMRMVIFVLLIGLSSYTAWFVSGKPVVTDEYLLKLNRLGLPQLPMPDNAWPGYEKAASLFVEADEELKGTSAFKNDSAYKFQGFAAMADKERKVLVAWVTANDSAWTRYEMASYRSLCWHPYRYDRSLPTIPPLIGNTIEPWLGHLRGLAKVGIWKARLAAEDGCLDESLDNCLVIARAGTHLQACVWVIDQLVGIGIGAIGRCELLRIIAEHDLPAVTLQDIQIKLTALCDTGYPFANFQGERLVLLDVVQHSFTRGGPGGGHLIPGQFTAFVSGVLKLPEGRRTTVFQRVMLWPMGGAVE